MTIATIILYYNTPDKTKRCLEACFKSISVEQEIILVDNNSLVKPVEDLLSKINIPKNLKVIKNKSNSGFSAGVNIGIKYALKNYSPKYIAVVNSDLYLKKNALKLSIDNLENIENIFPVGAITGKILNEDGTAIWQAGGYIKKFSMSGIPRGLNEKDTSKFSKPEFVGWASGAFSVFPTKVIKKIGAFSEDFFFGQEEWDLSLRLLESGYRILYHPDVIASHTIGGSYKSSHPILNTFNGYCNKFIMAKKHLSKFYYSCWLILFIFRTIFLSIYIAKRHSSTTSDFILQMKAIFLALLIGPHKKKIKGSFLKRISLLIGTSKSWPSYWGSKDEPKKSIVVHAGRRDNYQVSISLRKNNSLKFLVTDFYYPGDEYLKSILNLFSKFNPNIKKRFHKNLPSNFVVISWRALAAALLYRLSNFLKLKNHFEEIQDYFIAKKANQLAIKHNCHVLSYSTYATRAFKNINNKKILFQMHPYVDYVKDKMLKEFKKNPDCKSCIEEYEFRIYKKTLKNLRSEPYKADMIICPSTFCMQTLPKLDRKKLKVKIPYGSRTKPKKFIENSKDKEFNILFIGSLCQRKGVLYFIQVAKILEDYPIKFKIISRNINDIFLYKEIVKSRNIEIYENLNLKNLEKILIESSVFLFPSLLEGFAHVVIEAMNFGLVPIVTKYCCGSDIIKNNFNGYLINPENVNNIASKIKGLYNNQLLLKKLRKEANNTSKKFTEENFSKNLINFYNKNVK